MSEILFYYAVHYGSKGKPELPDGCELVADYKTLLTLKTNMSDVKLRELLTGYVVARTTEKFA